MQKKLVVVGNSLGLVIDKPIRAVLGLTRDTPVEVTFDGRRLIVERAEAAPTDTTFESLDRWTAVNVLLDQFGLANSTSRGCTMTRDAG